MSKLFRIIQRTFSTTTPGLNVGKGRAAFLRAQGQPLTIEPVNTESNSLSPSQVKIQVQYCSLNSNDVKFLEDCKRHPLPYIPGYEFSGEIVEVGEKIDEIKAGQSVVGVIPARCGGLKTEVNLNTSDVWPLPTGVSTKDAAALVCGHSTALLAFSEIRPLDENDVILVIAGAGGFGLAAVDIAASVFKAKVIALADTEGKAGLLRDRGAFAAFKNDLKHNYKEIMSVTDKKGVDIIYDAVGGPILNTVIKCLKDDGVILGTYRKEDLTNEDNVTETDEKEKKAAPERISDEVMDRLSTISLTDYKNKDQEKYYNIIEQTLQFCDEGLITAHISQTFNLQKVNDAIEYIKGKMCTGKVLIKIEDEDDDDDKDEAEK